MRKQIKITAILLTACILCGTIGCAHVKTNDRAIMHEEEFGGVYVDLEVTAQDAVLILRYLIGMVEQLPIEAQD